MLAGALVTYGGVSLFRIVGAPMAQVLFRVAGIPRRLMPAAIAPGASTFTMSALREAGDPQRHPDAVLRPHAARCAARNIPWFVQDGEERP